MKKIETSWICTQCGQEVESGLMNWSKHIEFCAMDAPNMNIRAYWMGQMDIVQQQANNVLLGKIYQKMNEVEREEHFCLMFAGTIIDGVVLMGSDSFKKYAEFQKKIIAKYKIVMEKVTDQTRIPFGVYKGTPMADVPADYLLYLLDEGICFGGVKEYIKENKEVLLVEIKRQNG